MERKSKRTRSSVELGQFFKKTVLKEQLPTIVIGRKARKYSLRGQYGSIRSSLVT